MRAVLLVLATLAMGGAANVAGCKDEKSGVEKRAEELAAESSAAKASASAAASQVDPAELKYRERKKSLENTVADFKADEGKLMAKDPTAIAGVLRKYFEPGAAKDKDVKTLEAKRKKDGSEGYRMLKASASEVRLSGNMEEAEVEITEETGAKGVTACLLYVQKWKYLTGKWVMTEQLSAKKIDCP